MGELGSLFTDGDWIETKDQSPEGIRLVQTGNIGVGVFKDRRDKARWISEETFDRLKCEEIFEGDILVSRLPDPVGRACLIPPVPDRCITGVDCAIIRLNNAITAQFVMRFCNSTGYFKEVESLATGATRKRISRKNLGTIKVPLPPLEEQERIVEVLDEAFSAIDKAKVNIERNLTNARELFQSRLNDIFSNHSEDWEVRPLGEVCSIVADLVDPRQDEYLNQLHVGGGNIESESGQFIGLKTSAEEGLKSGKFPFTTEDVLYNKIRPYLVKVARPDFEGICSADMYPLRPSEDFSRDFLFYALISERFTSYAISVSARAGMPKVNRKDLFNYDISFPLKKEQERITKELDELSEMKRTIETKYRVELKNLEELRQSILEQAFEGKLTEPVAA